MVLRLSRLLSESAQMRAAAASRPPLVIPPPAAAVSIGETPSFGADLEKVLRQHQDTVPMAPSPASAAAGSASPESESAPSLEHPPGQGLQSYQIADTARVHREMVDAARRLFHAAATAGNADGVGTVTAVRMALDSLEADEGLLSEVVRNRREFRQWPERSANVAILSMRLGMECGLDEKRCLALGMCGLTHDLGMLSVPEDLLTSQQLSASQLDTLRRHPQESLRMLRSFGDSFAWIGKIVVQAHERSDGSGYPRGLAGDRVHKLAAILGLADTYEAMAHPRPDRRAQAMYNALKQIIDHKNTQFDRELVKVLLRVVSIFPLGSLVKLNSGAIGRVIGTQPAHPTRPLLDIMVDPRGRRLPAPEKLDLADKPLINIVDPAIEEADLP